jgi:hypothetical protein
LAEVLIACETVGAFATALDDDANSNKVADGILGYFVADFKDATNNLVTGNHGVGHVAPVSTDGVNV